MGRQKALLPWAGTTLIAYQISQLSSVEEIQQIVVVTGHEPDRVTEIAAAVPGVIVLHNEDYRTGKVSSIKAGITAASPGADAILLLAVDQPRSAAILSKVVRGHVEQGGAITVPSYGGRRGHPIVFAGRLRTELLSIAEKSQGLREVLQRHGGGTVEVDIADPMVHVDLNRPSDLME